MKKAPTSAFTASSTSNLQRGEPHHQPLPAAWIRAFRYQHRQSLFDGGFNFTGFIPGRDKDVLGLAAARSWITNSYNHYNQTVNSAPSSTAENRDGGYL